MKANKQAERETKSGRHPHYLKLAGSEAEVGVCNARESASAALQAQQQDCVPWFAHHQRNLKPYATRLTQTTQHYEALWAEPEASKPPPA
jgi:hypothetical protein